MMFVIKSSSKINLMDYARNFCMAYIHTEQYDYLYILYRQTIASVSNRLSM